MSEVPTESPSERELELLRLLSQGLSNREIAQTLYISPNTVKVHLRNIYAKLNVRSRTEATMVAVQRGWVKVDLPEGGRSAAGPATEAKEEGEVVPRAAFPPAIVSERPLTLWQRIYLVVSAALVVLGAWLTWPRQVEPSRPISDLQSQSADRNLSGSSRWKSLAQMSTPRSRLAVVSHRDRIYAIAGETASGASDVVEAYTLDTDDWTRGADKLTPVANVGAVVLGERIYVPGGSMADGQMSDSLEVYDPGEGELGTWSQVRSMPQAGCAYAIAAYEGELYLFGGWNGSTYVSESYRYDPVANEWHALSPMPTRRGFVGAGVIGEHIYVVGGYDGEAELATCEVYDPRADNWAACPSMTVPRGGIGTAVIANTLYVIGGGWQSYLVENEYFSPDPSNPGEGTWQTFSSPLLQEWRNLGVTASETTLHAIGGWDGALLGVNQAYRAIYRLYLPSAMGIPGQ